MTKNTTYKTFEDWHRENRHVRKGERSHKRSDLGIPLFSFEQTEVAIHRLPRYYTDTEDDMHMYDIEPLFLDDYH